MPSGAPRQRVMVEVLVLLLNNYKLLPRPIYSWDDDDDCLAPDVVSLTIVPCLLKGG